MADLDVTELLTDPDLCDPFTVIRRTEVVSAAGRTQITEATFPNVLGVVVSESPSSLDRTPDGQTMPRVISVVTKFRLRGPAPGFQPDQVVIDGIVFTVNDVMPFTRFGRGFVEAMATSMNAQNPPPA